MSIIRQATFRLLAETFTKYQNIDDQFSPIRDILDDPLVLELLTLLEGRGGFEDILEEIDSLIFSKCELCQTLNLDISEQANKFFLRLVHLKSNN